MTRRILTTESITELLDQGCTELQLAQTDIVTPLAGELARERGLSLLQPGEQATTGDPAPNPAAAAPVGESTIAEKPAEFAASGGSALNREVVRRSVITALGTEPAGLDALIDRFMPGEAQ